MNKSTLISKIRELDLPFGQYIVVGGAVLAAHGIRETSDLDIVVTPALFEALLQKGWPLDGVYEQKWNRKRLKEDAIEIYPDMYLEKQQVLLDIQEAIDHAEIIDGIPFQTLEHLLMCKTDTGREKDMSDVVAIRNYLANQHE